jgi:hypothetical protein
MGQKYADVRSFASLMEEVQRQEAR